MSKRGLSLFPLENLFFKVPKNFVEESSVFHKVSGIEKIMDKREGGREAV